MGKRLLAVVVVGLLIIGSVGIANAMAANGRLENQSKPASEKALERAAWVASGEEGPPPWASEKALERAAWVASGEEGPPPWAKGKAR